MRVSSHIGEIKTGSLLRKKNRTAPGFRREKPKIETEGGERDGGILDRGQRAPFSP